MPEMITKAEVEQYRADTQYELDNIPPTAADTAEWIARHERAVFLQGVIAALDTLLSRMNGEDA